MLDESGSVKSSNFNMIKQFVQNIVKSFDVGDDAVQVAVMTFSTDVKVSIRGWYFF